VPIDEQWRLGTGVTFAVVKNTDLKLNWYLIWTGDLATDQSKAMSGADLSGQYDVAWIQTIIGNAA
jgi:long-chain fatty acid transport protein